MNIRPFNDLISALGAMTVNTTAQTYYNINGFTYLGAAGIAVLKGLPENVTLAAFGTLDIWPLSASRPPLTASIVIGGTSLESPLEDHISASSPRARATRSTLPAPASLPRSGDQLPGKAAVDIGAATVVSKDGIASPALSPQAVSVGQRIDIGGVSS